MKRRDRGFQRKATRILKQRFDAEGATGIGGLNQLAGFVKGLGVDRMLADRFRASKAPWAHWRLDRVIRMLLDSHFAGVERVSHFEDFEAEPLLCALYGVDRLIDFSSIYRELRRVGNEENLGKLLEVLEAVAAGELRSRDRVVLEFDSSVETVYGEQEGAAIGPNSHKPGRPSYHPLFARDRITDLVVHHLLRPGNTNSVTDGVTFIHRALDIVRNATPKAAVLARLDSGFETDDILGTLEWRRVGYVVKARATMDLASQAMGLSPRSWTRIEWDGDGEQQVASFEWCRPAWKRSRRIVVVRKREIDPVQGHLFDAAGWSYSLFVTNLDWPAEEVVRFYDKRADVERTICELKYDVGIDKIPTNDFGANAADLAIKVLARNLLILYRDRGLKLGTRERVATLRRRYLQVAGWLVATGHQIVLRLSAVSSLRHFADPALAFG